MFVTRRLSQCLRNPEILFQTPEGPNSGYLVLQDEESETTTCFGLCKDHSLRALPFPQNKKLYVGYGSDDEEAPFIPVMNKPLSSNLYYVIKGRGKNKGKAHVSLKEEDMAVCCNCSIDADPRPLYPEDPYQQFEVFPYESSCSSDGTFYLKSSAPDGVPPAFLRRKGWSVYTRNSRSNEIGEAAGVDAALRARLPDFNFPPDCKSSEAIVVGKWYVPFMFIRDGKKLKDQMKKSMFYEMILEQNWEQIFGSEFGKINVVSMDVAVQNEVAFVDGKEAAWDERNVVEGAVWFSSYGGRGEEMKIGVSAVIMERMKWEEERVGWVRSENRLVRVSKGVEELAGVNNGDWRRFGCYVLVERFKLKRMDGSVALSYEFKHTHQMRSKWE